MFQTVIFLVELYIALTDGITVHPENNACTRFIDYPMKAFRDNCYVNPNVGATAPQMIALNGYDFQTYEVVSEDGYKSKIFRIQPQINDDRKKKQPIILEHGIMVNSKSMCWIGNRSLAYVLANAGYDVWIVNQRDSGYTTHIKYKMSDYNFWTNSLDDLASKGVPAILNTVATETNKSGSIIYIGHSRGTTLAFMYGSEYPEEFQNLLRGMVALAPIAYFSPVWYIKFLFHLAPAIGKVLRILRIPVLFYPSKLRTKIILTSCTIFPYVCKFIITLSSGSSAQLLPDDLLALFSILPSSVSVMQLLHYSQIFLSGKFQKYDYGKKENLLKYQQEQPPLYNLSNYNLPTYMFFGKRDILIKEKSVKKLFQELGSSAKEYYSVPIGIDDKKLQLSHNGFFYCSNLNELFYPDLFRILEKLPPK